METKEIVWKDMQGYVSGKNAFVGKIKIGSYHYNGIDRDPSLRYVANSTLPSLKSESLGKFPTEQEAMDRVVSCFNNWIKEISK